MIVNSNSIVVASHHSEFIFNKKFWFLQEIDWSKLGDIQNQSVTYLRYVFNERIAWK